MLHDESQMIYEQWFVSVQERIGLPEASTERVWSWELQVDGGQEPFSPTGTDGSVAVVWRRSLQMEGAVQPKGCRTGLQAANLEGLETAEVLEATAGLEAEANMEAVGLEAAAAAILEANYLEVLEAVGLEGLEGLEAAAAGILEADYLEDLEAAPNWPGAGSDFAAV
ncbi:unnamed protein product [Boreogadus saida]